MNENVALLMEMAIADTQMKVHINFKDLVDIRDKYDPDIIPSLDSKETITISKTDFLGLMFAINALCLFKVGGKI